MVVGLGTYRLGFADRPVLEWGRTCPVSECGFFCAAADQGGLFPKGIAAPRQAQGRDFLPGLCRYRPH